MADQIVIEDLELSAQVGITEEERATPQRLTATIVLDAPREFGALRDDIRNAVDYFRVARSVQAVAAAKPRRLIETLVHEIADSVLREYPVNSIEIHLRKFIMSDTSSVGVRIRRDRGR